MRLVVFLCTFFLLNHFLAVNSRFFEREWMKFKLLNGKFYSTFYDRFRFRIWRDNFKLIRAHNLKARRGQSTYKLAMNKHGDLTDEEFARLYTGLDSHGLESSADSFYDTSFEDAVGNRTLPETVDWYKRGFVNEVDDQGKCGACWSFAVAGAVEAFHYKQTKNLVKLSKQQQIDCSTNKGCGGGKLSTAYKYVIANGLVPEEEYPYIHDKENCSHIRNKSVASIGGFGRVPRNDEASLTKAVAFIGPISVGFDAKPGSLRFYSEGVYYDEKCTNKLTHALLVIGYGTLKGEDYYLVKNSWGEDWGNNGFGMVARNKQNHCGIAKLAFYPN